MQIFLSIVDHKDLLFSLLQPTTTTVTKEENNSDVNNNQENITDTTTTTNNNNNNNNNENNNEPLQKKRKGVKEDKPSDSLYEFGLEPFITKVPKYAPLTLTQQTEFSRIWPVSYSVYKL